MIVSFSLDDLKKSVPGAADLANMTGDELSEALRRLLGKAAEGAVIRVDGKMISLDFGEIPEARLLEAERLCEKASRQANKGELPKAASIYRRALELNPSLQIARRALAMVLLEARKSDDAIDVLLDALKTDPRDHEALVILGICFWLPGHAPPASTGRSSRPKPASTMPTRPCARTSSALPLARKIESLAHSHDGPPGSEYDLVDEIACLIGVRRWYEWENETGENTQEPTEP